MAGLRARRWGYAQKALVFAVSLGAAAAQDQRLRWRAENRDHDMFVELGRFLREAHPGALLATGAAGKIPYFSRLETVDMLGLNDRHIAMTPPDGANPGHNKYDPDYVFARRPDVICTFLLPGGDLAFGITRARYEPLGYELAHLALRTPRDGVAVAGIRGMAVDRVFAEYGAEAGLACLVRNPSSL